MCGIAGVWVRDADLATEALADAVRRMTATLYHRGPDDEGAWIDGLAGVGLGHRRLSILDPSPLGHQPMVSSAGRYVVSFNGELYNFGDLRDELVGSHHHRFRGGSDTEVLLAAFEQWGLAGALTRFNGMYAFALWDARSRMLHLVRDRMGEKPLYYGWVGGTLLFGSELRALRAHPIAEHRLEIDRDALAIYLRLNYVPAPHSIYRGVAKLPAGTVLTVRANDREPGPQPESFWPLKEVLSEARRDRQPMGDAEATDRMDSLLRDAVQLRMQADVPLGAFLSGGIDSSTIVALMQAQSDRPVRTFTVGFRESGLDESQHASAIANHLGTNHTEINLSAGAALDLVPRIPEIYDEPFADPSQLPTVAIARAARSHVTVCLSGDGGDEVFGGYNRYTQGQQAWRMLAPVPKPLRRAVGRILLATPPMALERFSPPAKVQKLASLMAAGTADELYIALVSAWDDPDTVVKGGHEPRFVPSRGQLPMGLEGIAERMMFLDSLSTLPDEMLAKVDRASMSVGLETRVPLLDHRVMELAWRLPADMRIRNGRGKWLLREVLHRYVPREVVDRPKMGFDPPVAEWLRGPLRPWASDLLDPARLGREGYLRPEPVNRCWSEHLAGRRNWDYRLWSVLMFQAWLERQ